VTTWLPKRIAVLAAIALALSAVAAAAAAQEPTGDLSSQTISLDLREVPFSEALADLACRTGIDYVLAHEPQVKVTLALENVSAETALKALLSLADMTYRLDGEVYVIEPGPEPAREPAPPPRVPALPQEHPVNGGRQHTDVIFLGSSADGLAIAKINLKYADPVDIAAIFAGIPVPPQSTLSMLAYQSPYSPWNAGPYQPYGGRGRRYGAPQGPYAPSQGYLPGGQSPFWPPDGSYDDAFGVPPSFGYPF